MTQPVLLNTARGTYRLTVSEESAHTDGSLALTMAAEHQGGLEKFAFRCQVASALVASMPATDSSAACARLGVWLQAQFEQIREAALKSIRSERRLAEFQFDQAHPGPFITSI